MPITPRLLKFSKWSVNKLFIEILLSNIFVRYGQQFLSVCHTHRNKTPLPIRSSDPELAVCTPQLLSEEEFDLDVKSSIMEDACHYDCNQVEYEAEISVGDLDITPALLFHNETVTYRCAFDVVVF